MWELFRTGTEMSAFKKTALVTELASEELTRAEYAGGIEGYIPLYPG